MVTPLFDQCLELCASNMQYIDSLVGFPEDFGVRIFERGLQSGKLDAESPTVQYIISLLCEAYPHLFSEVRGPEILVLNEYEDNFMATLQFVTRLDLSNTKLDDEHEILSKVPELAHLHVLILQDVPLTERGMRRITYPCFHKRKLPSLYYLDVSGMKLSEKYLKTLRHLPQLKTILLYRSSGYMNRVPEFRLASRPQIETVEPNEMPSRLISRWSQLMADRRQQRKAQAHLMLNSFYSRKGYLESISQQDKKEERVEVKVMLLRTPAAASKQYQHQQQQQQQYQHQHHAVLRPVDNINCGSQKRKACEELQEEKPSEKKLRSDVENIENVENTLLDLYR